MTGIEEKEIESNIEKMNDKVTSSLENNEFDQIWPLNSSSTSQPKIVSTSGNLKNYTYILFCFVDNFVMLYV